MGKLPDVHADKTHILHEVGLIKLDFGTPNHTTKDSKSNLVEITPADDGVVNTATGKESGPTMT